MSNVLLVGTHWGDEGKGKIVDVLSESVSGCVRFCGTGVVRGSVHNEQSSRQSKVKLGKQSFLIGL